MYESTQRRSEAINHTMNSLPVSVLPDLQRAQYSLANIPEEIVSFHRKPADRAVLEQLRTLRSRLCEIAASQDLKSILVTSAVPGEGKSLVAMNLAFSLNKLARKKILLVDCDLRRPRIQSALRLPKHADMRDYLAGNACFEEVGFEVTPGLHIIPTVSTESAPELLHGSRMVEFMRRARQMYDFVILDSPPLVGVADSELLVSVTDGVLFVVRADSTDYSLAVESVNRVRPKLIGAVLNGVAKLPAHVGYYYDITE
jgi:capsular exopolysaccharide synthesis family protein